MNKTTAFCLFNFFPHGGLQRDFLRIATKIRQTGSLIRVYTMSWQGSVPEGFDVRIVQSRGLSNHRRAKNYSAEVQKQLEREAAALVVGFNKMAGLDIYFASDPCFAARVAEKNAVYRITGRCRTYLALERAVFGTESHTHVLMIAPKQVDEFGRYYNLQPDRYTLLGPGLDENFMPPTDTVGTREQVRREFGVEHDNFLLLQVGSAFKTKGVDRAIYAIASLPAQLRKRCIYLVAGSGKQRKYKRLAAKLGIDEQVRFAGVRQDVPELMAGADVLLHPARLENTGLTLLEALSSGLPVLCTGVCGYSPIIGESSGGMVLDEPFCQHSLNSLLQKMLDRKMLAAFKKAGQEYAGRTKLTGLVDGAVDCIMERLK